MRHGGRSVNLPVLLSAADGHGMCRGGAADRRRIVVFLYVEEATE